MILVFWIGQFIFSWTMWLIFAKKGQWHKYLSVCIFASWLSLVVEAIMVYYNLWSYSGHPLVGLLVNGFGVYIVTLYLFTQWLPDDHSFKTLFWYFFKWTLAAIIFEMIHAWLGHITYHKWWNIGFSYLADWFLFWLFFKYHLFVSTERRPVAQ